MKLDNKLFELSLAASQGGCAALVHCLVLFDRLTKYEFINKERNCCASVEDVDVISATTMLAETKWDSASLTFKNYSLHI